MAVAVVALVLSLVALVLLGAVDVIDAKVAQDVYMCEYRAVLRLVVLSGSSLIFAILVLIVHARRTRCWKRRDSGSGSGDSSGRSAGSSRPEATPGHPTAPPVTPVTVTAASPGALRASGTAASGRPLLAHQRHGDPDRRQCVNATRTLWFLFTAVLDTGALFVDMVAAASVTPTLRAALQQATIPLAILASHFVLRRRYGWGHFVAVILILAGMVACQPIHRPTNSIDRQRRCESGQLPQRCCGEHPAEQQ